MLEIRNISKKYSKTVLDNVSFLVEEGMVCGLFGANGAGKSTLLKIIAGLEIPSGGEVLWDGRAILPGGSPKIGAMIESPCFFPGMSGYENLRLLAHLAGDCKDEAVLRAIKAVGLSSQKDILFKKYSLGMKQRLYFAFAFMRKPSLLVLDEPFSGIDPIALDSFERFIKDFASTGMTILISSHEIRELQTIVDKAVFLDKGKMIYENDDAGRIDIFKEFLYRVSPSGEAQ